IIESGKSRFDSLSSVDLFKELEDETWDMFGKTSLQCKLYAVRCMLCFLSSPPPTNSQPPTDVSSPVHMRNRLKRDMANEQVNGGDGSSMNGAVEQMVDKRANATDAQYEEQLAAIRATRTIAGDKLLRNDSHAGTQRFQQAPYKSSRV
ncbi:hypothetical protein Tco_1187967, partial [Tanacetum coccineum]